MVVIYQSDNVASHLISDRPSHHHTALQTLEKRKRTRKGPTTATTTTNDRQNKYQRKKRKKSRWQERDNNRERKSYEMKMPEKKQANKWWSHIRATMLLHI